MKNQTMTFHKNMYKDLLSHGLTVLLLPLDFLREIGVRDHAPDPLRIRQSFLIPHLGPLILHLRPLRILRVNISTIIQFVS